MVGTYVAQEAGVEVRSLFPSSIVAVHLVRETLDLQAASIRSQDEVFRFEGGHTSHETERRKNDHFM